MSAQLALIPTAPPKIERVTLAIEQLIGWQHAQPSSALLEELRAYQHLLEPILVVPCGPETFTFGEGRRRVKGIWMLAKDEQWPTPIQIEAAIVKRSDLDAATVGATVTLMTHGVRSPSPASELAAIEAIIAAAGEADESVTIRDIATKTGMPLGTVQKRLRLRELIPELREAFDRGAISANTAHAAARLSSTQQEHCHEQLLGEERLTARAVRDVVRRQTSQSVATLPQGLFCDRQAPWQLTVAGHLKAAADAVPAEQPSLAEAIATALGMLREERRQAA